MILKTEPFPKPDAAQMTRIVAKKPSKDSGRRKRVRLKPPTAMTPIAIAVILPAPNRSAAHPPAGRISVATSGAKGA
ncbi:MAG: hypothetical protein IPF66_23405 [Holophagales bacterium]|nr:hypothetical protein [Holophagales bacterium]